MKTETNHPLRWVPSAYFAMGLPFVILNMVCVLMFKGLGIADSQIALWTSIIMFPWTLKFLWSPLLELLPSKRMIVVATQIISGAGFACVALALHLPSFFAVCIALLAVVATPLKKQPVSNVAENTVYVYPLEIYVFVSNIQFSRG